MFKIHRRENSLCPYTTYDEEKHQPEEEVIEEMAMLTLKKKPKPIKEPKRPLPGTKLLKQYLRQKGKR
jgi:hypothetical protein